MDREQRRRQRLERQQCHQNKQLGFYDEREHTTRRFTFGPHGTETQNTLGRSGSGSSGGSGSGSGSRSGSKNGGGSSSESSTTFAT